MVTSPQKVERLELRLNADEKKLFQRAQKLSGDKSLSSFVVRILRGESEKIISTNDRILNSERDKEIFFEAIMNPPDPNEKLIEATLLAREKFED